MKYRTIKKWRKKGYRVLWGTEAVKFNKKGTALYNKYQVQPLRISGTIVAIDYDDFEVIH